MEPRAISHFDVLSRLGAGGMGVVYRARDRVLGREVALKLVRPERAGDASARERFLREARAVALLNHPGIATIYEAGEAPADEHGSSTTLYIAQELVEGQTLAERLRRGPLEVDELVRLGVQMADALGEAHSRGIVHRDVKPSNMMLTPGGRIKVLDFGLARRNAWEEAPEAAPDVETWSRTAPGVIAGTPAYMPPEQIAGEIVDARADVYSTGCVLYEMAAGTPPFTGASSAEVLRRSLTETPRPVADLRADVPHSLSALIARALARDPRERFKDGRELCAALREVFARGPTTEVMEPVAGAGRRGRSRPTPALLLGVAVAGIALAALAWLGLERTPGPALAFKERDYVLVADVVNGSGEPVFDLALKSALETDLAQSRYVNVLDQARVQGTLQLMRQKPDARLDVDLARGVCRRTGARALVVPQVLKAGEAYKLTVSLVDPASGRTVADVAVTARSREQVLLSSIDQLTSQLRRRLGESLASIARSDPRFTQYTTSSLEALELLAVGARAWNRQDFTKAERSLREALKHDARFAAARGSLGLVLIQFLGKPEEGKAELEKALEDAGEVSQREHLHLRAVHRQFVMGDLQGALEDYRFISELYPDTVAPYNNSGRILHALGRYKEAAAMYERGHEADPQSIAPLWNLFLLYISARVPDPQGTERVARALVALQPDHANAAHALAWSLVMQRKYPEAEEAMRATLRLDPDHPWALPNLGHLQLRRGAAESAVATYRRQHQVRPEVRETLDQSHEAMSLALALRAAGREAEARAEARKAADALRVRRGATARTPGETATQAALLALAGEEGAARGVIASLEKAGLPTGADAAWLARAWALLGDADRAVTLFQHAVKTGYDDLYFVLIDPGLAAIRDRKEVDALLPGAPASRS